MPRQPGSVFTRVQNKMDQENPVQELSRHILENLTFKVSRENEVEGFKNQCYPNDSVVATFVITAMPAIDIPNPVQVYKDYLSKTEEHYQQTGEPEIDMEPKAAPECVDTVFDETVSFDSDEDGEKGVISFHFPSSESLDDEVAARPLKKRKLFSDNCNFFDSPVEVSKEMLSITTVKKTGMDKLEITNKLSGTEEFLKGLRETASVDLRKFDVGITSTSKDILSYESSGYTDVLEPDLNQPIAKAPVQTPSEEYPNLPAFTEDDKGENVMNLVRRLRGKKRDPLDISSLGNVNQCSVGKVVNGSKPGRFQLNGEFRLPYSR